jgi:4-hydroxy-2-oxoheptanedioate aldolase
LSGGSHGSADRRFAGYGLESGTPEYVQALEDCVVALMIEKETAVDDLESILSVDGVDMVVFGGNDYWMSAGKPGNARTAPDQTSEVMMHVYKTAISKGIQPQAPVGGIDQVQEMLDFGVKHFCVGNDYFMIYRWLNENVGAIRKILND